MSRYIDAEKLIKDGWSLQMTKHSPTSSTYEVMELDCVPTADVVEVVRCKDCKHRYYDKERKLYYCEMYFGLGIVKNNNYCSYGERAEA